MINAAIFILLEVAALNMLSHNGTLQNVWLSKCTQAFSGTVWGSAQNVRHYFSLKKRNDALARDNHDLRVRIAELESMLADSMAIRRNPSGNGVAGVGISAAASLLMFLPNVVLFVLMQSKVMNTMAHSGMK